MPLHFTHRGSGEPVVLIHGLFGSLENVGGIARLLSDEFHVYSVDLPNHGRSYHSDTFELESIAADLAQWMTEQGIDSAHLVGHSLGGKAAMELALRYPSKIRSLVVLDIAPVKYQNRHVQVFAGLQAVDLSKITQRREADTVLQGYVDDAAVRSFLLKNLSKQKDGSFAWRMNLPSIARAYPDLIGPNVNESSPSAALFVKGGDSDYIAEEHRAEILARFPNTQLKVVGNTGHWLHAEKPNVVARLIRNFVSDNV